MIKMELKETLTNLRLVQLILRGASRLLTLDSFQQLEARVLNLIIGADGESYMPGIT
jgi:hypothetical protein